MAREQIWVFDIRAFLPFNSTHMKFLILLSCAVALEGLNSNSTSTNASAFVIAPQQKLIYVNNPLHAVSVEPLSQLTAPDDINDAPLMRDIEMLNNMLAEVVERDNPVVHDLYTRFRRHGKIFLPRRR